MFEGIKCVPQSGDVSHRFSCLTKGDFIAFHLKFLDTLQVCWISADTRGSERQCLLRREDGHFEEAIINYDIIGDFVVISRDVPEDMIRNFVEPHYVKLADAHRELHDSVATTEAVRDSIKELLPREMRQ